QPADIERPPRLGTSARKPPAAERLHTDDGADDIAVHIKVSGANTARDMRDRFVQPGMQAESEAVAGRIDIVDQPVQFVAPVTDDMQDGTENFTLEILQRL